MSLVIFHPGYWRPPTHCSIPLSSAELFWTLSLLFISYRSGSLFYSLFLACMALRISSQEVGSFILWIVHFLLVFSLCFRRFKFPPMAHFSSFFFFFHRLYCPALAIHSDHHFLPGSHFFTFILHNPQQLIMLKIVCKLEIH